MKTIKSVISILFLLSISFEIFAQTGISIKGRTSISEGDYYYTIVMSAKDSTIVASSFFDTPEFVIDNIQQSECILQITSPFLFKDHFVSISNLNNQNLFDIGYIQLEPVKHMISEVQVVATPPKAKFSDGKFVYDIQSHTDFKTLISLDDIFKRLPLVSVSNEKINVFGKKNTIVLVNGIPPKNDNWELISPENIKEIEIITNPSAEYSASGMAVINIVTKRKIAEGFNGQASTSVAKGEFWRSANTLQLGYSTDRISLFTTANYNPNKRLFNDNYERYFSDGSKMLNDLDQVRTVKNNYNLVLGIDYNLNSKNIIGIQYQRTYQDIERNTVNTNNIHMLNSLKIYNTQTNVNAPTTKSIYDLNYSYSIDEIGKKVNINMGYVDYIAYENNSIKEFSSYEKEKYSYSKADINLYTANIDYIHKTESNFTGKIGANYSHNINNSFNTLENIINNETITDNTFTNKSQINENKIAGYVTGRKTFNRLYISGGIRFEHVSYINKEYNQEEKTKRFNDLFPSFEIGYDINEKFQTNLSYSNKVHYPKFQDLNPSTIYVDTVTYYMGNTNLRAEYSQNISYNIVYNKLATLSFGYSHIKDPLYMFVRKLEPNSIICVASTANLKTEDIFTASLSSPYKYKNWTTHNTIGINYNKNKFENEGIPMNRSKALLYTYTYNELALPKDFNISVIYQYNSAGVNGIFYHEQSHIVNCAINKSFLNKNLTLSLRMDDLFRGNKQKTQTNLGDLNFIYGAKYDASYVTFSMKYKFGKSSKKYEVKENSKEELKRIK